MDIFTVLAIIWLHWLADFVLQTDAMAKGKSKSNRWLGVHVVVYGFALLVGVVCAMAALGHGSEPLAPLAVWAAVNAAAHFATDYVTSRVTSRLWAQGRGHAFFVVIGLDQALHLTVLLVTANYLLGVSP